MKSIPESLSKISYMNIRQDVNEETEQAVYKYGERVPQFTTQHNAINHVSANSLAVGQDMMLRGFA